MDKIVVIMPTYNEATNIGLMIDELVGVEFPKITKANMLLLIVDDNSPDGTGNIVKDYMKKYKNVHLLVGDKKGLGMAYVRGMRYSMKMLGADAVIEMDADFQHDPVYVKRLVNAYLEGADYVIGSRYVKGGSIPKSWAWYRKAMSFFGNLFARVVLFKFNLHDMTTGFRLTRVKGVLEKIKLESIRELHRFAHKIDLFYQTTKLTKNVVEVPIHFKQRTKDISKFSFKEMVASYTLVIKIRLEESKRIIRFGVVGGTGFVINYLSIRLFRNFGFSETFSWFFATELAIINNFIFNNLWTFSEEKISGIKEIIFKFVQFNVTSAGALIIQSVLGPLGVGMFGEKYTVFVLAFVVAFIVLPYNYLMYNLVIWKTWKLPFGKKKK
ncbi:MAG: glycosyltransferase [Patescibacteria group bacterium]